MKTLLPLALIGAVLASPAAALEPLSQEKYINDRLIAARNRSGLVVAEAYMIVHHPQWRRARELDQAMMPLSAFDAGPDLVLYFKHMMVLNGEEEYRLHFNEADALSDSQRGHVERQLAQFRAWYARWSQEPGTPVREAA